MSNRLGIWYSGSKPCRVLLRVYTSPRETWLRMVFDRKENKDKKMLCGMLIKFVFRQWREQMELDKDQRLSC